VKGVTETSKNKTISKAAKPGPLTSPQNKTHSKTQTKKNVQTEKSKITENKKATKYAPNFFLVVILLALTSYVVFEKYPQYFKQPKVQALLTPKKEIMRSPAQVEASSDEEAAIGLANFNRRWEVFIDGEKKVPDELFSIKVPIGKEFVFRVQIDGKKHFIKTMNLDQSIIEEIIIDPSKLDNTMYVYAEMTSKCLEGQIEYEIFGEKRVDSLPLDAIKYPYGIAFPVNFDSRMKPKIPTHYSLKYKDPSGNEKKVNFTIDKEKLNRNIDFCEILKT
jgi:hypothetical protein